MFNDEVHEDLSRRSTKIPQGKRTKILQKVARGSFEKVHNDPT